MQPEQGSGFRIVTPSGALYVAKLESSVYGNLIPFHYISTVSRPTLDGRTFEIIPGISQDAVISGEHRDRFFGDQVLDELTVQLDDEGNPITPSPRFEENISTDGNKYHVGHEELSIVQTPIDRLTEVANYWKAALQNATPIKPHP